MSPPNPDKRSTAEDVIQFVRYAERTRVVVKAHDLAAHDDHIRELVSAGRLERYAHPGGIRWSCLRLTNSEREAAVTADWDDAIVNIRRALLVEGPRPD